MARLIDRDTAMKKMRSKELRLFADVRWNGEWYSILSDEDGPVYSYKKDTDEAPLPVRDTIYLDNAIDTITYRMMHGTNGTLG